MPDDYKLFVFDGEVEYIQIDQGRFNNHTRRIYDSQWNEQPFRLKYPKGPEIERPPDLERMKTIAQHLADDLDFARVDLYNPEEGAIYFEEITFAPGAGTERFLPKEYDFEVGLRWDLDTA